MQVAIQNLMKEMSNRLPKKEISLCRVKVLHSTDPQNVKVQEMMQDPCFKEYPPIVVCGDLSTGQASEKTIREICEGVSKGKNVLEQ